MCMKIEELVHSVAENFFALHNIVVATRTPER